MPDRDVPMGELINRLRAENLVDGPDGERIGVHLTEAEGRAGDPVYIRALAAFGAWAAAMCFIGFLSAAGLIDDEGPQLLVWGVFFLAGALVMRRLVRGTFFSQLALAFTSAGHILVLWWSGEDLGFRFPEVLGIMAVVQAAIATVMYWPYRDRAYRFMAPLAALVLGTSWVLADREALAAGRFYLLEIFIAVEAAAAGLILAARFGREFLKPLGYACAVAAPGSIILLILWPRIHGPVWVMSLLLAFGLCALYLWAGGGRAQMKSEWFLVAAGATFAFGAVTNPGILAAVGLLVLGYAVGDKVLLGLGILYLPAFIVVYYYDMDVDLAYKSYILAGSGLVLVAVRWAAGRRPWAGRAAE